MTAISKERTVTKVLNKYPKCKSIFSSYTIKGVIMMVRSNFMGRGQRGGMGMGFRGNSSPWPNIGRGRGGMPRCGCYQANAPQQSFNSGDEITALRNQARNLKNKLGMIESRIQDMEKAK